MATFERCEHTRGTQSGKVVEVRASIVQRTAPILSEEERKERRTASWRVWYEKNREKVAEASYKRYHENREKILQNLREQRAAQPPKEPKKKKSGYVKTNKIFKKEAAALAAALKDIKLVTLDLLLSNISLQV